MTTAGLQRVTARRALDAWRDPEFWGAKGLGCARCHENAPDVNIPPPLCLDCLLRCFHGWDVNRLITWLGIQRANYVRQQERVEVRRRYREGEGGSLRLAMEYRKKYAIWLLPMPEP